MTVECFGGLLHQFSIAGGQTILATADVVLQPIAHVASAGQYIKRARSTPAPAAVQVAWGGTCRISLSIRSSRCSSVGSAFFYAHHDLHLRRLVHQPGVDQPPNAVNVVQVEQLDLRTHIIGLHLPGQCVTRLADVS